MKERLSQMLKIRPGEAGKVALLFGYLFLAVSTFITGRIARDSLFLTRFDKSQLGYMYITVAAVVPAFAYLYARVADRFRRDKIILTTLTLLAASMLGLHVLVKTHQSWVYIVLYNWVEVLGAFLMIQFWTFASDVFSSREAKRLFPLIGGGGIAAGIICGVAVSAAVKVVGTENLFIPQAIALMGCAALVTILARRETARLQEATFTKDAKTPTKKFGVANEAQGVFASKHLKLIAGMTVATFITVPLIDYQFKALAREYFTTDGVVSTDALSSFMGLFYTVTGILAAVMQLGMTGRLLERFGVVVCLLVLPLSLLGGTVGMVLGLSTFGAAVFAKGAENAFRYSIYDATVQVIYTPVPGHVRGRAKTFIDGILKPWAGGIAGAAIVLLVDQLGFAVPSLSWLALAFIAAWVFMISRIRGEYVAQLIASLRRRRLDFSKEELVINDEPTVQVLRKAFLSNSHDEVRNAVELARRVESYDISDDLAILLAHSEADVRLGALELLSTRGNMQFSEKVLACFQDDSEAVRAAAIRCFCSIVGEPALMFVRPHLQNPAPQVRGAAVASLILRGGLEGILLSAEHLRNMQTSTDERMRLAAAEVFREIGVKNFYQPVLELMRDPGTQVQNAAITAAGVMKSPELIPALVYKLSRRDTSRAASMALSDYGEAVSQTLGKVLSHEPEDVSVRRQVPRILERIGTPACLELLMACLDVNDPETRKETARAAARLREKLSTKIDETRVRGIIDQEIQGYYQELAALTDLSDVAGSIGPDLLRDAIQERLAQAVDRIFKLMGIIYPLKTIELVHINLKSSKPVTRANAIEVLDNLLEKDFKRRLLPLLEDLPRERVLQLGAEHYRIERCSPEERIAEFVSSREPWMVVVALYVSAELGLNHLADAVKEHIHHLDPLVRETAVRTLAVMVPATEFIDEVDPLFEDEEPRVRAYTRYMATQARRAIPSSDKVLDALEAG